MPFDMKLNRQFVFTCMASRDHAAQSNALELHNSLVTVKAAITHHKSMKKYYMVEANGIELIAQPDELTAAQNYMKQI
jgi:hypothetical protein